jgi:hypothetical protein
MIIFTRLSRTHEHVENLFFRVDRIREREKNKLTISGEKEEEANFNCFQSSSRQQMTTSRRAAPGLSGPLHTAFLSGPLIFPIIFSLFIFFVPDLNIQKNKKEEEKKT